MEWWEEAGAGEATESTERMHSPNFPSGISVELICPAVSSTPFSLGLETLSGRDVRLVRALSC